MKKTKRFIYLIVGLLTIHVFLVATNYDYLYSVIRLTVMKGQLGPSIDEYPAFSNRLVKAPETAQPWPQSTKYNQTPVPTEHLKELERLESIAYLVIKNDSICTELYWDQYTEKSPSNSFSMAKSIVSFAVGSLIKEGKINSVSDPVCNYLPRYCQGDAAQLTIRDLLTMSSGINFDEHYMNPLAYPAKANYGRDLVELNQEYHVTETPGQTFNYQSGTTQILAFLVEEVAQKTLSEYISEKFWKPMGAEQDALWSLDHENGNEKAFCCFNSNARDFARWGYLALHHGKWNQQPLIDSIFVAEATQPATWLKEKNGNTNNRYGYQWWTFPNYKNRYNLFYMRGILGQYVIVIPEENMVVVRLGHKRESAGDEHPKDFYHWVDAALEMYADSKQ